MTGSVASLPRSLASRFDVLRTYAGGEGWCGVVTETGGEPRLLKVLPADVDPAEASLLASLSHPAIPAVSEVGRTDEGRAYLLREHLEGEPLDAIGTLSPAAIEDLARQLLEVLAYVHLRGVLHLDLKPANVLRQGDDAAPRYAVLDFGLGARRGRAASGGTPLYVAPEVLLAAVPDARSDLFSLGVLLLVAMGRLDDAAQRRVVSRPLGADLLAAAGIDPATLPGRLADVLPRLVAARPEDRFADAREALEALGEGRSRPSTAALRPDPIAVWRDALPPSRDVGDGDVVVVGGEGRDRRTIALHLATVLPGVVRLEERAEECVLRRGDGDAGATTLALGPVPPARLAEHLAGVLTLEPEVAERAAHALLQQEADSVAELGDRLVELAAADRIRPDGVQWVWPAAATGRPLELGPIELPAREPAALREAAARGRVEAAMLAFTEGVRGADAATERTLRRGLVEGLLRAGEPLRALPLAHDLPVLRARALFDLGRFDAAERALAAADADADAADERDLLHAGLALARGRAAEAEERLRALCARSSAPQPRIALTTALAMLGRERESIASGRAVLTDLSADAEPYLRATTLTNLADAERRAGELEAAAGHHHEALQLYRRLGNARMTALGHANLGVLAKDRGRLDEAREHLRRARALFVALGHRAGTARAEASLGILALERGDPRGAVRRLTAARETLLVLSDLEVQPALPLVHATLARAHAELGERDEAERWLARVGAPVTTRVAQEVARARERLDAPSPAPQPPTSSAASSAGGEDGTVPAALVGPYLQLNRVLAREQDLDRLLEAVVGTAVAVVGGGAGHLLLQGTHGIRGEHTVGSPTAVLSRSLVQRALREKRTLTHADALADRALADMPSVRGLGQHAVVCVPFRGSGGVVGALYVEHPSRPPFDELERETLEAIADQAAFAVRRLQARRSTAPATRSVGTRGREPARLLGDSDAMVRLRTEVARLGRSELPVLVRGETGTGKELVARALHDASARRRGPFVAENCAALPADLLEAELFGHVAGAFTGAEQGRPGLLEAASGGTLFLDEIGDLPLDLQAKLLRALEEGAVRPVGGSEPRPVDVRLIAATHRDPAAMVAAGTFRRDLYHRLAAAELVVPPLRERGDDCVLLAEAFLSRLARGEGRQFELGDDASRALRRHRWPGNVRELEHAITAAALLAPAGRVGAVQLAEAGLRDTDDAGVATLQEVEARVIRRALAHTGGDKARAAAVLGISRSALYNKLRRLQG